MTTPARRRLLRLREDLQTALQVEHATIPVYFAAWASLQCAPAAGAGPNTAAHRVLRSVLVEEMLHMAQVANLLVAIGGTPTLTAPGFVLPADSSLPGSSPPIPVQIRPFSPEALAVFLDIERPSSRDTTERDRTWSTIGQFYERIRQQYTAVLRDDPELPIKHFSQQIQPAAYYGSGELIRIHDHTTATHAIDEVIDQGEGADAGVFDDDASIFGEDGKEPAHYFRFLQLELGRSYRAGDTPATGPTGPRIVVSLEDVNPMRPNATNSDYDEQPEIQALLHTFNCLYGRMLAVLEGAFNGGGPTAFQQATATMFTLGELAATITRTPDPTMSGNTVGLVFAPLHGSAPRSSPSVDAGAALAGTASSPAAPRRRD
jgi:hypothetical protein